MKDSYIVIIATVMVSILVFVYTKITDLRIEQGKALHMIELHQAWTLRLQDKVDDLYKIKKDK